MKWLAFNSLVVGFFIGLQVAFLLPEPRDYHWQSVVVFSVIFLTLWVMNLSIEGEIQRIRHKTAFIKGEIAQLEKFKELAEKHEKRSKA